MKRLSDLFVLFLLAIGVIVIVDDVEGFSSNAGSFAFKSSRQRSVNKNNKLYAAAAAAGALEVEATSEVFVGGTTEDEEDALPSFFLKKVGAIAIPRGVAPGCLSGRGCPIIIDTSIAEDHDDCQRRRWKTIWESTPKHRRSDLVWVIPASSATADDDASGGSGNGGSPIQLHADWQREGTVVVLLGTNYYLYGKHSSTMKETILNSNNNDQAAVSEVVESWDDLCELLLPAEEQAPDPLAAGSTTSKNLDNHPLQLVSIPSIDLVCTGKSNTPNTYDQSQTTTPTPRSVIVVGGGILGSSIARALAQRSTSSSNNLLDVTLLDPTPTGLATPASWAWLNANSKPPQQYKSFNQMGLRGWRLDPLLSKLESLKWSGTIVKTSKQLHLTTGGYKIEGPLTPQRIQELEPEANFTTEATDNDSSSFFYYFADEGHVDPQEAVSAIRQEAANLGVSVVRDSVVDLLRNQDGRVIGVKTSSGLEQYADVVIVAAGANSSDDNLGGEGVPLVHNPSKTYFGEPITKNHAEDASASPPPILSRTLVDMIQSIYLAQRPDGTVVAGGGSIKFPPDEPQHVAMARQVAESLAPNPVKHSPLTHAREVISKPMPQDGFPILGYVDESSGLYAVVSHSGMTLSPLIGQLVAAEVIEQVSLDILEDYRPSRFTREKELDPVQDWQEAAKSPSSAQR